MDPSQDSPASFLLFAHLPAEMRLAIWTAALPAVDPPAILSYDEEFITTSRHYNFSIPGFERCALVRVDLPKLFFVNHEARDATRMWARLHDYKLRDFMLFRFWNPATDPLFIARHEWTLLMLSLHLPWKSGCQIFTNLRHLVLTADTYKYGTGKQGIISLLHHYGNLQTVQIIHERMPLQRFLRAPITHVIGSHVHVDDVVRSRWELVPRVQQPDKNYEDDDDDEDFLVPEHWTTFEATFKQQLVEMIPPAHRWAHKDALHQEWQLARHLPDHAYDHETHELLLAISTSDVHVVV